MLPIGELPTQQIPIHRPARPRPVVDRLLVNSRRQGSRLGAWLRDGDHKLLAITAGVTFAFLLLVGLAG